MTRKEMADQVKYWLGLQDIQSYNETDLVLNQLYWGTIDLLARTKCVARSTSIATVAGLDTYTLDHDVLAIVDFDDYRPKARRDQTNFAPAFTLVRADLLRITPIPGVDGELEFLVVKRPEQMSADDDSPGDEDFGAIPDEYQDAIVTYALWKCADYTDDSGSGQGERYRILYEGQEGNGGKIAQIKSLVNRRGTARIAARTVRLNTPGARGAWMG